MNNKSINARMQQKIDTYENWSKATNFIPLKGELIIYTTDENGNEKIDFKVGTGELDKNIHQLDFVSKNYAFKSDLETKADLVDGKVPLEQLPDNIGSGSGGGLTEVDWETNVINKPFEDTRIGSYYSQAENPNPVSFDNAMVGYSFYKISDLIPTREEIFNSVKVIVNGNALTPKENEIQLETDDFVMAILDGSYAFMFINKSGTLNFTYQGYPLSFEVPEAGIYYVLPIGTSVPSGRIIEIILGGELKTLDIKYLPENMALGYEEKGEGITWDGNTDGLTEVVKELEEDGALIKVVGCKVSDETPSVDEIAGKEYFVIEYDEETSYTITENSYFVFADNGSYLVGESLNIIVCLDDNTVLPLTEIVGTGGDIVIPEAGIWFTQMVVDGVVINQTTSLRSPDTLVPINEKFIPDTIARKSDLDAAISSLDSALTSAIGSGVLS